MSAGMPARPRRRPWVKVCGVTRPDDAATAAGLGAAMVGINFWPRSPRFVGDTGRAREIAEAARPRALVAGVFVDEDPGRIEELLASCALDLVQLHGDEPAAVVARFAPRAIRALRAESATAASALRGFSLPWKPPRSGGGGGGRRPGLEEEVFCWLLDGPAGARYGGAGAAWDWALARPVVAAAVEPVLVAGGIRPDNVRRALAASGAAGVDVASGVERAPGVKDRQLLERFLEEVARVRA